MQNFFETKILLKDKNKSQRLPILHSISGLTTKLHLAITPDFHIVEGYLSGGNIADISCADDLTACVSGCYIIEDKGYDSNKHRIYLLSNNNIPVIPGTCNGAGAVRFSYFNTKYWVFASFAFFY